MIAATPDDTPLAAAGRFLRSLRQPAHILVAVSGGSDSTGLLFALADQIKNLSSSDIVLSAATVDHGLRTESAGEARAVAALCARIGIPHVICRWQGDKPKTGLMAAAREARYALLAKAASDLSANVIVTAHTLDDQEETLAMRAARVAGPQDATATGIADAVLFDRRVWVLRPFLTCRRDAIRAFLDARSIAWIDDPSNEDPHYERVRVRGKLAGEGPRPVLNDGAAARLSLSARGASWVKTYVEIHEAALCCIRSDGLAADRAVLSYVLSHLAAVFGGHSYGPGSGRLARILDFIAGGAPGRRTAAGVVFDLRRDGLYLARESRGIEPIVVAPKTQGIWDGRFDIVNDGAEPVRVTAAGARGALSFPEGLPKSAMQRARAAAPLLSTLAEGGAAEIPAGVAVVPRLQPFDRFLTRFDLTLANGLAAAFARNPYLPLPL